MGRLIYGQRQREIEIEDRTLAHLRTVIIAKLRRGESFCMSWANSPANGSGRSTIWIHPCIPLEFNFSESRPITMNRVWVELLLRNANAPEGLRMVPEPAPEDPQTGQACR